MNGACFKQRFKAGLGFPIAKSSAVMLIVEKRREKREEIFGRGEVYNGLRGVEGALVSVSVRSEGFAHFPYRICWKPKAGGPPVRHC